MPPWRRSVPGAAPVGTLRCRYEPAPHVAGRPHILLDAGAQEGTLLALSHWAHSPTPPELRADLSAEIALRWLALGCPLPGRRRPRGPLPVSVDHLDQDGLVALHALLDPAGAWARRAMLVEVARAGDFACFAERDAARVSFALATLADPQRSPLPPEVLRPGAGLGFAQRTAALVEQLLSRLPGLLAAPSRWEDLWAEEDAAFSESERMLASGQVVLDEAMLPGVAVVTVPEARVARLATRFFGRADAPCHPAAVYNLTACSRVLTVQGRRYELVERYESWVRIVSRPVPARVDFAPLAAELDAAEPGPACWSATPPSALVGRVGVRPGWESGLAPAEVAGIVGRYLAGAPPAWPPPPC